jgi:tetratricopeptide (TPR) repeat protein
MVMSSNTNAILQKAYDFIEGDQLEEARQVLKPALEADRNNPDVWWLYAHAVADPETARLALHNVLRLDENYPEAQDLLRRLENQQKGLDFADESLDEPAFVPGAPSVLPGIASSEKTLPADEYDPDVDFDDEVAEKEPFHRRPLFYIPLVAALVLAGLAIVILRPFAADAPAVTDVPATQQAVVSDVADVPPTQAIIPTAVELSADSIAAVTAALSQFELSANGVRVVSTSLGSTLLAEICTNPGAPLRTALPEAMNALARASSAYVGQFAAVGVNMLDCTADNTILRSIGVTTADVASFTDGSLDVQQFQAKWVPIQQQ